MANLFDPSYHRELPRYTDAQVQTSSDSGSPGVDEVSRLYSRKLNELHEMIRQRGPRIAKMMKKPAHKAPTIPGTDYPMPPDWDPSPPRINPLTHGDRGWPPNVVPVEIFEHLGSSLSRDDLLSMRLVNHEFEAKISSRIFQTVVIPFKSDIYGVVGSDEVEIGSTANNTEHDRCQAKGKCLGIFFACSY